jgi:hypothetical protein
MGKRFGFPNRSEKHIPPKKATLDQDGLCPHLPIESAR